MDLLFPLIELSVVFGVAGWVTYLQKSPGRRWAGAETEDEEGPTPGHKVMPRGRTASDADGAAVDYS